MSYDSPFWAIEGEWFLRLLILKRKVWWLQKDKKEKTKFVGPCRKLNPGHLVKFQSAKHYTIQSLLSEGMDFNKVY